MTEQRSPEHQTPKDHPQRPSDDSLLLSPAELPLSSCFAPIPLPNSEQQWHPKVL